MNEKRSQVWIETVIYLVIGMVLIGLVLAFVVPKIIHEQERAFIEKSVEMMRIFDEKIASVISTGEGNVRQIELTIKKGELSINPENDMIIFTIEDLRKPYSEIDIGINSGKINLESGKTAKGYKTILNLDYDKDKVDILYGDLNAGGTQKFEAASTPYRFSIENKGGGKIVISEDR